MLAKLSARLLTILPRRTKVLRPAYPKVNPGPVHVRAPPQELKLWELSLAIAMMSVAMLGPAFYYVPKWKYLKPVEDSEEEEN